jgi:hypothetical protein
MKRDNSGDRVFRFFVLIIKLIKILKVMTYENYKTGMLRVFIVLSVPLVLVTYNEYDLSFANKFVYSFEILSQTLVFFWCIYLISLWVVKPFIVFTDKK